MKFMQFIRWLLKMIFRQSKKAPIIIWYHNGATNSIESLKIALSSGLVNHVMIYARHRDCLDWESMPNVLEAIQLVKDSSAKLIWSRCLWPYWDQSNIKPEYFFNVAYYLAEIELVRLEAEEMGADFVALDIEAYGHSIMKVPISRGDWLYPSQQTVMRNTVSEVVEAVGQVDFIYPAGNARRPAAPWNFLSKLGKNPISEDTYHNNSERLAQIWYEYKIFGAYLNTTKVREDRPELNYYLVPEIFEKVHLWAGKGLFLYSKEGNALAVAQALLAYSKTLSQKK